MSCGRASEEPYVNGSASRTAPYVQPQVDEKENRGITQDDPNFKHRDDALRIHVNRLARGLNIGVFDRKKARPHQWELRIWNILGVDDEKLLVIKGENEKLSAALYLVINEPERPLRVRRQALLPKEGWPTFTDYVNELQINNGLQFQLDSLDTIPIVDESVLFLEYKGFEYYKFAYFGQYTKSPDGIRLLRICKEMERQFQVGLGCSPSS